MKWRRIPAHVLSWGGLWLCALVFAPATWAACTVPAANAGDVIFNTTYKVMQYCNGTDWINTGAVMPSAPQTGCTNPAATGGSVLYNGPLGVIQFCNGSNWVNTACAATRKPNGPGCGSDAAGALRYVGGTVNEMQFCDSTDWVAMGWPCADGSALPSLFVWNSTSPLPDLQVDNSLNFTPDITYNGDPGSVIMYSIANKPPFASFNSMTGKVSGTPTTGDTGTYTFTITVDDGSQSSNQAFTITVTSPPLFVWNSASPLPNLQVGNSLNFTPNITYNGDPSSMIMYSIANKPPFASFNMVSGKVSGTPTSGEAGTYTFTITIDDGAASSSKSFTLTVVP